MDYIYNKRIKNAILNNNLVKIRELIRNNPRKINNIIYTSYTLDFFTLGEIMGKENFISYTALMFAVENSTEETVRTIIEVGTNINFQNNYGITALMIACYNKRPNIVKLLVDAGANVNLKSKFGTALSLTVEYSSERKTDSKTPCKSRR